jgi:hypothetical protein
MKRNVAPISQVRASALLLLLVAWNKELRDRSGLKRHNVHTKCRDNYWSIGSKIEKRTHTRLVISWASLFSFGKGRMLNMVHNIFALTFNSCYVVKYSNKIDLNERYVSLFIRNCLSVGIHLSQKLIWCFYRNKKHEFKYGIRDMGYFRLRFLKYALRWKLF